MFAFEFLFAPWDAERAAGGDRAGRELGRVAWVMSNHDFDRLATRVGPENLRAAAVLLLTLPGVAFLYQGDELGLANGPGAETTFDRAGRDRLRHPMQWETASEAGSPRGEPWLPLVDPEDPERRRRARRPRLAAQPLPALDRAAARARREAFGCSRPSPAWLRSSETGTRWR